METAKDDRLYDVAIIGGGLAGLALSIQLARKKYSVILFEKEVYPFHRVCGEYISNESKDFLCSLGLELSNYDIAAIHRLELSSPGGRLLTHELAQGGFGISRYLLDHELAKLAVKEGVRLQTGTKVSDVQQESGQAVIIANGQICSSRIVCGSFGKRSNLDIKWNRHFIAEGKTRLENYIGVKYHILADHPVDTIGLHNFSGGYCGISRVENGKYNLCYLTTAANLQRFGNIPAMEKELLCRNPHLKKIWTQSEFLFETPVTISQISFSKKTQVENNMLMLGDAAGMITPLCGNGMSIALHCSKIAAGLIHDHLEKRLSQQQLEERYQKEWNKKFSNRLQTGRRLQVLFGDNRLSGLFISAIKPFPKLVSYLVKQTHGNPF